MFPKSQPRQSARLNVGQHKNTQASVENPGEHLSRMEGADVSFLRKQESRLLCACYGVAVEHRGAKATWTPPTFWIPACAGRTPWV